MLEKNFSRLLVVFASSLLSGPAIARPCATLFQHADFTGHSLTLQAGENNANFHSHYWERRKWRGNIRGWSGHDVTAGDALSSMIVQQGCMIEIFEHVNFQGFYGCFQNGKSDGCISNQEIDSLSLASGFWVRSQSRPLYRMESVGVGSVPNITAAGFPQDIASSARCICE